MNLYDNIAFPLREHTRKSEAQIRELVHRNAELVGLMDHLKKLPGEVSGGMKKRAGLARAMVTEPEIVLFDEPDSGLDPVRVAYLDELVVTAQKETGATFFIITHNISSVMRTAEFMGVLFRSNLVKFASKPEMLDVGQPDHSAVPRRPTRGSDRDGRDGGLGAGHEPVHRGRHGRVAVRAAGPSRRAGAGLARTVPTSRSRPPERPETEKRRQPRVVRPGTSGVLDQLGQRLSRRRRLRTPSRP